MPSIIQGKLDYVPVGKAIDVFYAQEKEIAAVGPVGTGKSRAILEKIHTGLCEYPDARALMVRETRKSLTQTGIVTFEKHVLPKGFPTTLHTEKQEYLYPNNSVFAVLGLDDPTDVMSGEFDWIYIMEAKQVPEKTVEDLITRLRNFKIPYQQLLMDTNPGPPTHWLRRRMDTGKTREIKFTLKDNPVFYDNEIKDYTPEGRSYLEGLMNLTGARFLRNVRGIWAAEEGLVYEEYDPVLNITSRKTFVPDPSWMRIWCFDFGFRNPFVWLELLYDEINNVIYVYRQYYRAGVLVADAAKAIRKVLETEGFYDPAVVVTDHQAHDVEIIQQEMGVTCTPAHKSVIEGIECVANRFRCIRDPETKEIVKKPGLVIVSDSLIHTPDPHLRKINHPTCLEEELLVYVWDEPKTKQELIVELPVKKYDHACDAVRYGVAQVDIVGVSDGIFF